MKKSKIFRKFWEKPIFYLIIILLLGLFFRVYRFGDFYIFEHDQDLYSWIVKDILVDHHFRLIGQLTSVEGVFIGPFFYYILVPFFALFKMDPIGAIIPVTILSLFTIISIYYVFDKFFGKSAGLIGAFLYAVSMPLVSLDQWIVPTQPTILWSVWYLYTIFSLLKGNFNSLIISAILLGLIWHIHIALIPLIVLIPTAIYLSEKKLVFRQLLMPLFIFLSVSSLFFVFEVRHGFLQTHGIINSFLGKGVGINILERLSLISSGSALMIINQFFDYQNIPAWLNWGVFILLVWYLKKANVLLKKQILLMSLWIGVILFSHFISKRAVSQYYFNNLIVISLLIFSLIFWRVFNYFRSKIAVPLLVFLILIINLFQLLNKPVNNYSYKVKKRLVEYIKKDAEHKGFPCVGVDYIADFGRGVGFRYLFWLNSLNVVKAGDRLPVYKIVIPWQQAHNEIFARFGSIGLIMPANKSFNNNTYCLDRSNQLESLFGFTR